MATKLALFNAALDELGHPPLSDTGEPNEAGRTLVRVYNNVVDDCIAAGSWNFAVETIQADADTGVTPAFGYVNVFAKPTDWVRTHAISGDENFSFPLLNYYDDMNFWSADVDPIYVRYVSDDTGLGYELTRWTSAFRRYVELSLAHRSSRIAASDEIRQRIASDAKAAKKDALNQDVMNEPQPKFAPPGSWTMSRSVSTAGRERGKRNSLLG